MTSSATDSAAGPVIDSERPVPDAVTALARALGRGSRRWGVSARDVPALLDRSGPEAVSAAMKDIVALGGRVLRLNSVAQASPTLDRGKLGEIRAEADRLGVDLQVGLGGIHPARSDPATLAAAIDAGHALGVSRYHVSFGTVDDRFAASPTWEEQLRAAVGPVRDLVARAEQPVVMKTHEEMTTFELARLCDAVGPDRLRVGFSPVNVVARLESPSAAFKRLAGRVDTLFLDDYRIVRTREGAARRLCRLADGAVDWLQILADCASEADAILDIHHAEFDMPFFDPVWLPHQPDLDVAEFIEVLRPAVDIDLGQTPFAERREHGRRLLRQAAVERVGYHGERDAQQATRSAE